MNNIINTVCPVSDEKTNENVVRLVAGYTAVITAASLYFNNYFLSTFLIMDFALRAFISGKGSVLKIISIETAGLLKIKSKPIDAAPKKFAALLGLIFSLIIALTQLLHLNAQSLVVGSILIFCALLESVLSICLGCQVYSFIRRLN